MLHLTGQRTHVDREYDTQSYTWQFKGHTLTGPFSCGGQATPTASRRAQTFQNCVQINASLILDFNLSFKRIFLFPSPQLLLPLFFLRHSPLFFFSCWRQKGNQKVTQVVTHFFFFFPCNGEWFGVKILEEASLSPQNRKAQSSIVWLIRDTWKKKRYRGPQL